ncbi:T9SS type A sorting domain-containing protein [Subsaxibacter sp. CAU 1640]|uniref:T9SS type A sorting domain-containing protein n=1 Tax=Subsaxibacter sp. CAU 1640 TaxID=2933271 RepID=UPI002002CD16|nr:T9SS type A sorting domain-containing protein [Subsaxibacter sp. CAU 1640]MCK7589951.1 T9SS type A sorting domain-containing protein [Subsaxibacter sp. CAU 1640]
MKKNYFLFLLINLSFLAISSAQITLTQTNSNAIIADNTIACHANNVPADNQYFRAFDIAALGYTQFDVDQVSFGVQMATTIAPGFAIDITIYSNAGGAFPAGTLTEVSTVSVPIVGTDANTIKTVPINATVMAPAQLVVEINIPDEITPSHTTQFFVGSNSAGQSAPTYFSSVGCGIPVSTLASLGFSNVHVILNVTGFALSIDDYSVSNVSISPNPTSDIINIDLHPSNTLHSVEIYSLTGQLVFKGKNELTLNIGHLNSGVYMLQVKTDNGTASKKLIKS